MGQVHLARRPRRWDEPFGSERMPDELVAFLLRLPAFKHVDPGAFPDDLPLTGIVANDMRVIRLVRGDIVYREGSFHTSLFIVLSGMVRAVPARAQDKVQGRGSSWWTARGRLGFGAAAELATRPSEFGEPMGRNQIFGALEALTREPRRDTCIADAEETWLLEIRLPGLRALLEWSEPFRRRIDAVYRQHSLETGLRDCPLLSRLDGSARDQLVREAQFERFGDFGWSYRFQRERRAGGAAAGGKLILKQDDYLEDLLLIRAGFVRLSVSFDRGEKTAGYLSAGDLYGLNEIMASSRSGMPCHAAHTLRAIGFADIIRIPAHFVETSALADFSGNGQRAIRGSSESSAAHSLLDFMVDRHLINGTRAMVIDTARCVNCDDCVRACAATHETIPRFLRQGPAHDGLMVTQACMHCTDPVCLIDCPTGAIHRDMDSGSVVIDDAACIGCGTCAGACPYGNIRMEQARNSDGALHIDTEGAPILRAIKCDLCAGRSGGPACQEACPHDALTRVDPKDLIPRGNPSAIAR